MVISAFKKTADQPIFNESLSRYSKNPVLLKKKCVSKCTKLHSTLTSSSCGFLPKDFPTNLWANTCFFLFVFFNLGLCLVPLCNDPSTWIGCNRTPSSIIKSSTCSRAPVRWDLMWWPQSPDLSAWFGVYPLTYGSPPPPPRLMNIQVLMPWNQVFLSNAALWSMQASSQSSISRPEMFPSGLPQFQVKALMRRRLHMRYLLFVF